MSKIKNSSSQLHIPTIVGVPQVQLEFGDNKKLLQSLAANSVSCVIQDEPYGFNEIQPDINEFLKATFENRDYQRAGTGIDGAKWDCDVPPLSARHETFRVLVPGGHLIAFTGNKNLHLTMCTLAKAGFEIVDILVWLHGNGVPKGGNADAKTSTDPDLLKYAGARHNLSPSLEVMVLARKPIAEATVIENQKIHGAGLLNVGPCRFDGTKKSMYPKNAILENCPDVLAHAGRLANRFHKVNGVSADTNIIQSFFVGRSQKEKEMGIENENLPQTKKHMFSEKIVKTKNPHQTVKPIALMQYLIRLVSFEGDTVLDAYTGSGTTGIACLLENRKFIGAEQNEEFFKTAKLRIHNTFLSRQTELLKSNCDELIWIYDKKIRATKSDIEKQKLINELKLKISLIEHEIKKLKTAA
jgi:site-specific DNA-methyltransferase (adenine-specific)